jgi:hypothetical protein
LGTRRARFNWLRELLYRFEPTAQAIDFAVSLVDLCGWLRVELLKTLEFLLLVQISGPQRILQYWAGVRIIV